MCAVKSDQPLASHEIVTLAVFVVGGDRKPVDTEDVAIKANELAPGRFSWRKYPEQINIEIIRAFLSDAKKKKYGVFLSGSGNEGWMLTEAGGRFCSDNLSRLETDDLSRTRLTDSERKWLKRERTRLLATAAYAKATKGDIHGITRQEAEGFFRIDEYVIGEARNRKIARVVNAFREDRELGDLVEAVRSKVLGESQ